MNPFEKLLDAIRKGETMDTVTKLYAEYMLDRHGQNFVHTAKLLGIGRNSLYRWNVGIRDTPGRTKPKAPPQNPESDK